ncbi:MAG: cell division protein FtsZ [Patescibacteria group bacterium]|nr:cell division protein FtsZ [Patescibacteria group bacterium]
MSNKKKRKNNSMEVKPEVETFAKIKVLGVGGSGGAAIKRMIDSRIRGIEFTAINTDAQALHHSNAPHKIHIGKTTTRGLGAGMDPELGQASAEESQDEIHDSLKGSDMVFITCGLGGGTGTGAAPIIAEIARDAGALTVAVVTKPFSFEGAQRMQIAEGGLDNLTDKVDTLITIPNDRLLQIIDKKTSLLDSFKVVDNVLKQGVQGIADLITVPGLINVDFADVKSIMENTGSALMGIGEASGENRAVDAAKAAIDSPLLELSIDGARGILFTVTGGPNLSMYEVNEAARVITGSADPEAKIIFGSVLDDSLGDEIKITVIATGFGKGSSSSVKKVERNTISPFEEKPGNEPPKPQTQQIQQNQQKNFYKEEEKNKKPQEKVPKKTKEEEELEIPAFIRKKMM